jgi:hypothetical protein
MTPFFGGDMNRFKFISIFSIIFAFSTGCFNSGGGGAEDKKSQQNITVNDSKPEPNSSTPSNLSKSLLEGLSYDGFKPMNIKFTSNNSFIADFNLADYLAKAPYQNENSWFSINYNYESSITEEQDHALSGETHKIIKLEKIRPTEITVNLDFINNLLSEGDASHDLLNVLNEFFEGHPKNATLSDSEKIFAKKHKEIQTEFSKENEKNLNSSELKAFNNKKYAALIDLFIRENLEGNTTIKLLTPFKKDDPKSINNFNINFLLEAIKLKEFNLNEKSDAIVSIVLSIDYTKLNAHLINLRNALNLDDVGVKNIKKEPNDKIFKELGNLLNRKESKDNKDLLLAMRIYLAEIFLLDIFHEQNFTITLNKNKEINLSKLSLNINDLKSKHPLLPYLFTNVYDIITANNNPTEFFENLKNKEKAEALKKTDKTTPEPYTLNGINFYPFSDPLMLGQKDGSLFFTIKEGSFPLFPLKTILEFSYDKNSQIPKTISNIRLSKIHLFCENTEDCPTNEPLIAEKNNLVNIVSKLYFVEIIPNELIKPHVSEYNNKNNSFSELPTNQLESLYLKKFGFITMKPDEKDSSKKVEDKTSYFEPFLSVKYDTPTLNKDGKEEKFVAIELNSPLMWDTFQNILENHMNTEKLNDLFANEFNLNQTTSAEGSTSASGSTSAFTSEIDPTILPLNHKDLLNQYAIITQVPRILPNFEITFEPQKNSFSISNISFSFENFRKNNTVINSLLKHAPEAWKWTLCQSNSTDAPKFFKELCM